MNVALIFAGGTGQRMNTKELPKQFLKLHGKPIIIYTLEKFASHPEIDGIIVACLSGWIEYLKEEIEKYNLKGIEVIEGGNSGQESIYKTLLKAEEMYPEDTIVLINDGVRPLIDSSLISRNIESVIKYGSAISSSPAGETVMMLSRDDEDVSIVDRKTCRYAKAPQSFYLKDILAAHRRAIDENKEEFIDSASIMKHYGYKLHLVDCDSTNIKITTPIDYYVFRAIIDAIENEQIHLPEGVK